MRIICITGFIITLAFVLVNYILNVHFNWFNKDQNSILYILNALLLLMHIVIFAVYTYRRKYTLVFVFWILNHLVLVWYQFKLLTFDWSQRIYQKDMDAFTFYGKILAAISALMAIAILVSIARKRIPLVIFAIATIFITLITTKNWIPNEGFSYLFLINIFSPLLLALNYYLELKNYKTDTLNSTKKRVEIIDYDQTE